MDPPTMRRVKNLILAEEKLRGHKLTELRREFNRFAVRGAGLSGSAGFLRWVSDLFRSADKTPTAQPSEQKEELRIVGAPKKSEHQNAKKTKRKLPLTTVQTNKRAKPGIIDLTTPPDDDPIFLKSTMPLSKRIEFVVYSKAVTPDTKTESSHKNANSTRFLGHPVTDSFDVEFGSEEKNVMYNCAYSSIIEVFDRAGLLNTRILKRDSPLYNAAIRLANTNKEIDHSTLLRVDLYNALAKIKRSPEEEELFSRGNFFQSFGYVDVIAKLLLKHSIKDPENLIGEFFYRRQNYCRCLPGPCHKKLSRNGNLAGKVEEVCTSLFYYQYTFWKQWCARAYIQWTR